MSKPVFISGFKGSGKDTAADYLVENLGFVKDSFAAPLKDMCSAIFNWPRDMVEGSTHESREWREEVDEWWANRLDIPNLSPRLVLQLMGTEVMRKHWHENIWVESAERRIQDRKEPTVISDCRFYNELELCQRMHGMTVCVMRGPKPEWWDIAVQANGGSAAAQQTLGTLGVHASEFSWVGYPFDYVIENNGTLEDLYRRVDSIFA